MRIGLLASVALAFACSALPSSRAHAEDIDEIGKTLDQTRIKYEAKMQSIRDEVVDHVEKEIKRQREKAKPDIKEIDGLKNAKDAFMQSGLWPSLKSIKECRIKAQNAKGELVKAMQKTQDDYLRAARDELAKALQVEREQMLKESDIAPWRENRVVGRDETQRTIEATRRAIDLGDIASKDYRLEIVAHRITGSGALSLSIPVPGKKQLELKSIAGIEPDLRVLLSVRSVVISADLGVARPIPTNFKIEDAPDKLQLWADQGQFELKSIRVRPIMEETADEIALKKGADPKHALRRVQEEEGPAGRLTLKSKWRGDRWNGQNPNDMQGPQPSNGVITIRNGNEVELKTEKWGGGFGSEHWVFAINGDQLKLISVYVHSGAPATFTEVTGGGTIDGDVLEFACSARIEAHKRNLVHYDRFQLKRVP